MKIHLRQKKMPKKGLIRFYLEYYKGSYRDENGKMKYHRDYEFLDVYLTANPKTKEERQKNKEQKKLAETIRNKRAVDDQTKAEGIINPSKQKANFLDYMIGLSKKRMGNKNTLAGWKGAIKQFKTFVGKNVTFRDIDKQFCENYKDFLKNEAKTTSDKNLKMNSQINYFNKFRSALKQAVRDGIISHNPSMDVNMPKEEQQERQYLEESEIKAIAETECRYDVLKRAFLFSCLTGLRWSDIQKLKWEEVHDREDGYFIHFRQQKTSGFEYHPINESARNLLGERDDPEERVFIGLKYSAYMNTALAQWMLRAGITKHITFHAGRHSFAVNFLSNGGDIYTLSKFLGHSELKTTEIYANIVPKKKQDSLTYAPSIDGVKTDSK